VARSLGAGFRLQVSDFRHQEPSTRHQALGTRNQARLFPLNSQLSTLNSQLSTLNAQRSSLTPPPYLSALPSFCHLPYSGSRCALPGTAGTAVLQWAHLSLLLPIFLPFHLFVICLHSGSRCALPRTAGTAVLQWAQLSTLNQQPSCVSARMTTKFSVPELPRPIADFHRTAQ